MQYVKDKINYVKGDLLSVEEGIIVHGCNAQGVMGAGVAKAIKDKYPECFDVYHKKYEDHGLNLSETIWFHDRKKLYIANAITQNYFGVGQRFVNYAAIVNCFEEVFFEAVVPGLPVHFPKIGSGLGGGDWNIIEQLILDCDPENKIVKVCWEL